MGYSAISTFRLDGTYISQNCLNVFTIIKLKKKKKKDLKIRRSLETRGERVRDVATAQGKTLERVEEI